MFLVNKMKKNSEPGTTEILQVFHTPIKRILQVSTIQFSISLMGKSQFQNPDSLIKLLSL